MGNREQEILRKKSPTVLPFCWAVWERSPKFINEESRRRKWRKAAEEERETITTGYDENGDHLILELPHWHPHFFRWSTVTAVQSCLGLMRVLGLRTQGPRLARQSLNPQSPLPAPSICIFKASLVVHMCEKSCTTLFPGFWIHWQCESRTCVLWQGLVWNIKDRQDPSCESPFSTR